MKLYNIKKAGYTGNIEKIENFIYEVSLLNTEGNKQKSFIVSSDDDMIEVNINSLFREIGYKYIFISNVFSFGKVNKKTLKKFKKNTVSSFEDIKNIISNF